LARFACLIGNLTPSSVEIVGQSSLYHSLVGYSFTSALFVFDNEAPELAILLVSQA
jgi:hypothetical protein